MDSDGHYGGDMVSGMTSCMEGKGYTSHWSYWFSSEVNSANAWYAAFRTDDFVSDYWRVNESFRGNDYFIRCLP